MNRLTEKQSAGYDLKALNGEWCNHYCYSQKNETCTECAIYEAIQKLAYYENLEEQGKYLTDKYQVKCIECKFSRPLDRTKSPEKYFRDDCIVCECEDVVGDEPMIYLKEHYCSFGKVDDGC